MIHDLRELPQNAPAQRSDNIINNSAVENNMLSLPQNREEEREGSLSDTYISLDSAQNKCCIAIIRMAGLRPTRQRVMLASLLFNGAHRHVNAERLHAEACAANEKISLATVYNTLHQFCEVGLVRQIAIDSNTLYFDTNTSDHHHFYLHDERRLEDISVAPPSLRWVPAPPEGTIVTHIDILVRVRKSSPR